MRSISATLLAAQQAVTSTPYIHLVFQSADGLTTHTYSSDQAGRRILSIDHVEEPYSSSATIILRNDDRTIPNLIGYHVQIGYGYYTGQVVAPPDGDGAGNEYSETPWLWVKHQQEVSAMGRLVVVLEMEGVWERLGEKQILVGTPPYYQDNGATFAGITPYEAIELILNEAVMYLSALSEDDGIMDTYVIPVFSINLETIESAASLLRRLVLLTASYLKPIVELEFEVKYPQTGDSVDITYYSDQAPYFYEYMERRNVIAPNRVILYANDPNWDIESEASDQDSIDAYGDTPIVITAGEITNETDADNRAAAILGRVKMESMAGRMYAPHDCQLELYDKIQIVDSRGY